MLRHELQHYAYRDIAHHLATIDRYTTLAAEQWLAEGRRTVDRWQSLLHPPFAFLRNYVLRGGFRDGSAGFIVSVLNSYYVFLKLAKLAGTARRADADLATPTSTADVLPPHRHGADLARRTEPGAR